MPITDYIVEGEGNIEVIPENRTARIMGLERGSYYSYDIIPVNKAGEGKSYTTENIKTLELPSAPAIIGGDSENNALAVTWNAPADTGGTDITMYTIYARPADGGNTISWTCNNTIPNDRGELTEDNLGRLETGKQYYVSVAAVNIVGEGPKSFEDRMQVNAEFAKSAPDAPTDISASAGDSNITISWKAPENDGNSTITGYQIWSGIKSDELTLTETVDGYTFSYTDTNLRNGIERFYAVKAVNEISGADGGPFSEIVSETPVKINAPSAPANPEFDNEHGVSAYKVDASGNILTVTWVASTGDSFGGAISYEIYVDGDLIDTVKNTSYDLILPSTSNPEDTNTEDTASEDNPGALKEKKQIYNIQIFAVNEVGGRTSGEFIRANRSLNIVKGDPRLGFTYESWYSSGKFANIDSNYDGREDYNPKYSVPSAPEDVSLTSDMNTAVVKWNAPSYDGDDQIQGYYVYVKEKQYDVSATNTTSSKRAKKSMRLMSADTETNTETYEYEYNFDIDYGQPYWVYVSAYNAQGEGALSVPKYITPVVEEPLSLTGKILDEYYPENPARVDIKLTWEIPNTEATSYMLYVNGAPMTIAANSNVLTIDGTTVSYVYNGNAGNVYNFAVSSKYNSLESNLTDTETVDLTETLPTPNKPGMSINGNNVTLRWTTPQNDGDTEVDHYVIYVNGERTVVTDNADTTANLTLENTSLLKVAAASKHDIEGATSELVKYKAAKDEKEYDENTPPAPEVNTPTFNRTADDILLDNDNVTISWKAGQRTTDHSLSTDYFKVYLGNELKSEEIYVTNDSEQVYTFTFTASPGDDCDVLVVPYANLSPEDIDGPPGNVIFTVPNNDYKAPDKPNLEAKLSEDKDKITLIWTEQEDVEYYLIVDGDENMEPVHSGYEFTDITENKANYNFQLEAVKTYSDQGQGKTKSDIVAVNISSDSSNGTYDSDEPEIIGTISYDTVSKVFWKGPSKRLENEIGEIANYKVIITDGDKKISSELISANTSPLMYPIDFKDLVDNPEDAYNKSVQVQVEAYKVIGGEDVPVSISKPWIVSPNLNIVKNEDDFDKNDKDADVINPDKNGNGIIDDNESDSSDGEIRIPIETDVPNVKADFTDQFNNTFTVEATMTSETEGYFAVPLENLDSDQVFSIRVWRNGFTSYTLEGVPYASLSDVSFTGNDSVEMYGGNMDGDDTITGTDVSVIETMIGTGLETVGPENWDGPSMGDMNSDDTIDGTDILMVMNYLGKSNVTQSFK